MEEYNVSINIGRNDDCPCGSGKKFKKCCINTGNEYRSLGKNYAGKEMIYDYARYQENLGHLIQFSSSILSRTQSDPRLPLDVAINKLHIIYSIYNDITKQFYKYSPCKKGCSECCHIIVDTTPLEAEMIRRYIATWENLSELGLKVKSSIEEYIRIKSQVAERDFLLEYFKQHIPCVFLGKEGECLIYEVRPLNCRKFFVFTDPELCKPGETNYQYKGINDAISIVINGLNVATYKQLTYREGNDIYIILRHLPIWFKEEF